jgi:uncharacterized repeat protein (TIGR04138 family)
MPPLVKLQQYAILELDARAGAWPIEAYEFVHLGLTHTVNTLFGSKAEHEQPLRPRHVSGQELCWGLRDCALRRWGLLAQTVLYKWNITGTLDFGRIVFTLVEHGMLAVTDEDSLEDFRDVYDFKSGFASGNRMSYKI